MSDGSRDILDFYKDWSVEEVRDEDNTLAFLAKGNRGFLLNGGGIRDTDECIMQKIPVWSQFISQGMELMKQCPLLSGFRQAEGSRRSLMDL